MAQRSWETGTEYILNENFHGWKITWMGLRPIQGSGGYEFAYQSWIAAYRLEARSLVGVLAIARPGMVPYIHVIEEGGIVPRVQGDGWSDFHLAKAQPGRWDMTRLHIARPSAWLAGMDDAYEALQAHLLGATDLKQLQDERAAVQAVKAKQGMADGVWGVSKIQDILSAKVDAKLRAPGRGRDRDFALLVNRHVTPSMSRCAWAACMDGLSGCHINHVTGEPYAHRSRVITTMAEAERVGACCPCTCGADAKAMIEQMKPYDQHRFAPVAFEEAVQLGRKKPLRYAEPVELCPDDDGRFRSPRRRFGHGVTLGPAPLWRPAEPDAWYDRPLWPRIEPLFQYQEVA
jgi:hypothetical protein